jgi:hypothetical protein
MLLLVLALLGMSADDPWVESVFVRNSEVYATYAAAATKQLTNDGLRKGFAVASGDGKHIAFIVEDRNSLGRLVVMTPDGARHLDSPLRPLEANVSGMRFIEKLEWLTNDRLVFSGSVNPSTGEFVVVDIRSGKEVQDYFVEGFHWAPSPDGSHVAYFAYIPHFTPTESRRPRLCIDDECGSIDAPQKGYPAGTRRFDFEGDPVWSQDGTQIAILAHDYEKNADLIVVRKLGGGTIEYPTPVAGGASPSISWQRSRLLVHSGRDLWRLNADESALVKVDPQE